MPTPTQIARRARIKAWFKNLFQKIEEKILPFVIDASLHFMVAFKKVVDTGVLDKLADLTPTEADDRFVNAVELKLPIIIEKLSLTKECLALPTREERIICLANMVANLSKREKGKFYQELQTEYIAEIHEALGSPAAKYIEYEIASLVSYHNSKEETV